MSQIEYGRTWDKQIPRGDISWIVNKYHVSATLEEIGEDIRSRCHGSDLAPACVEYAEAVHQGNIALYQSVMRG
tara:strand:+ start:286 stop:507 length:222 start_codon:yes stop_codon:yes gene_type:complete